MEYGYIRVSSKEQNIDRQMAALLKEGLDKKHIFIDKQSGKNFDRPSYKRLLKKLEKEDVLIIKSIARLRRNYAQTLEQWHVITKVKQADIYVFDFPLLDTRKKDNDLTGTFIVVFFCRYYLMLLRLSVNLSTKDRRRGYPQHSKGE